MAQSTSQKREAWSPHYALGHLGAKTGAVGTRACTNGSQNTDLASNAQFYLGEIAYSQKHYEQAVNEYNRVLTNYGGLLVCEVGAECFASGFEPFPVRQIGQ